MDLVNYLSDESSGEQIVLTQKQEEISVALEAATELFGFKDPSPQVALGLVIFISEQFPKMTGRRISQAFIMAGMQEIDVDLKKTWGKSLTIPIVVEVIKKYKIKLTLEAKPKIMTLPSGEIKKANLDSRIKMMKHLQDLQFDKITIRHFQLLDCFYRTFEAQEVIDQFEISKKEVLNEKTGEVMEDYSLKSVIEKKRSMTPAAIKEEAIIHAKIELTRKFIANNVIDYEKFENNITNEIKLY